MDSQYPGNGTHPQQQYQYNMPQNQPPGYRPGKGAAIASLVCGIVAMVLPIPVLDLAVGIVGLCLAGSAKKQGYPGGMATAGLVCSIIGTVFAAIYTCVCTCAACYPFLGAATLL